MKFKVILAILKGLLNNKLSQIKKERLLEFSTLPKLSTLGESIIQSALLTQEMEQAIDDVRVQIKQKNEWGKSNGIPAC